MVNDLAEKKRSGFAKWVNGTTFGVAILVVVTCVCITRVMRIQKELFDPDKTVLRICHWQLELGYREGLQAVIDEYVKLYPDVEILQNPITETIYPQWINVHTISGTAPDIVEMGYAKVTTEDRYVVRFFESLTEVIDEPNPYNEGTFLEGVRWRDTFVDGMRGGYRNTLQDYYYIPSSLISIRLLYNKQILREATGSDEPPETLGELLKMCEQIRQLPPNEFGKKIVPIAASRYNLSQIRMAYGLPFTCGLVSILDTNLDGRASVDEIYTGILRGDISMRHPAIKAKYECMNAVAKCLIEGWMGMGRESAVFLFVQGNAAMMPSGSWDAMSVVQQARFDVGVMGFPLPGPDERWGQYVVGRHNDTVATGSGEGEVSITGGGGQWGIYSESKNKETAVDFLRFMTSMKMNELMNKRAGWLPVVVGAEPSELMRGFVPDPCGYSQEIDATVGSYAGAVHTGEWERYLLGETTDYEKFADKVEAATRHPMGGEDAWAEIYDQYWRRCRNQDRLLALLSLAELTGHGNRENNIRKYRRVLLQQIRKNNAQDHAYRFEQIIGKPMPEFL